MNEKGNSFEIYKRLILFVKTIHCTMTYGTAYIK